MRKLATLLAVLALAPALTACGNQRAEPPDLAQLGKPGDEQRFTAPDDSVSFRYPASWVASGALPPTVASLGSGSALATVYAYRRQDLGTDPAAVEASRKRLIASLRERDPGFAIDRTRITTIDGSPAVEVRGRGAIAGKPVRTRSVHVYKGSVEWVIDAYATPARFAAANRIGFAPMLASIDLASRLPRTPAG